MFDFNDAETQRTRELIPADTVATLHINVKPGDTGEGNWLKASKDGTSQGLDCEFVVVDGEHAKRKFWSRFTFNGESDGQKMAVDISRRTFRAILESARGIKPDDKSDAAAAARKVASYGDFDGIRFIGRIGVQPADGKFAAKNTLLEVITPDRKNWRAVEQVQVNGAARPAQQPESAPAQAMARPAWAK
jgi:hypothetical protein